MIERQGITLLGISVGNLDNDGAVQLTLPFDRYSDALDARSTSCASGSARPSVTRAVHVGRDPGLTVPLLPD